MDPLLVDELANELRQYRHSQMASGALAEHILAIPRIYEALAVKAEVDLAVAREAFLDTMGETVDLSRLDDE